MPVMFPQGSASAWPKAVLTKEIEMNTKIVRQANLYFAKAAMFLNVPMGLFTLIKLSLIKGGEETSSKYY
jgi:hypothetical protein